MKTNERELAIVIDLDTFQCPPNGTVSAVVYWEVNGSTFPEKEWNDFVLVVFEWWLNATCRLLSRETSNEEMRFMDGPFWVSVDSANNDLVLKCVDGRCGEDVVCEYQVSRVALHRAIHDSAQELLAFCHSANIVNTEVQEISRCCGTLASIYS